MWLGLLGFHISRNYARSETTTVIDLSASSGPAEAELTQRGVFYRGERIGYIRERLTPLENGYRAEEHDHPRGLEGGSLDKRSGPL